MKLARYLGNRGFDTATVIGGYNAMCGYQKVAEIWLKLFKKIEIYATILDNNVKYNYRKAVTQYMNRFELVVPCHFGLEAVVKREIYDLGYEITRVEDGRVSFEGDAEAICRANIFLRGAREYYLVGRFKAATFDELFENVKALPWENYIQRTADSG